MKIRPRNLLILKGPKWHEHPKRRNYSLSGAWPQPFRGRAAAIERNLVAISVKLGLSNGSADQHCSINDVHSGSHNSGTGGRKVLLTIPPVDETRKQSISKKIRVF